MRYINLRFTYLLTYLLLPSRLQNVIHKIIIIIFIVSWEFMLRLLKKRTQVQRIKIDHETFNNITRMWVNAQRDGRPAEYRWRPLFNAAKFRWRPQPEWRAVTLPRRECRWKLLGCPKLPHRSQPLVGRSSPYCGIIWRTYFCLTFFWLSIRALVAKIQPDSCTMVRRWRFFASFLRPVFPFSRFQYISDLHSKFALRPHHV